LQAGFSLKCFTKSKFSLRLCNFLAGAGVLNVFTFGVTVNDVGDAQLNEFDDKFTGDTDGEGIIVEDGDTGEEVRLKGENPF
jgi:hypothetical protein